MIRCWRHFKALTKKNFINSKRAPVCTILELVLGPLLLILLVWIRTKIQVTYTDLESIQRYKHGVYPALKYDGGKRNDWVVDLDYINNLVAPFMEAFDYAPRPPVPGVGESKEFDYSTQIVGESSGIPPKNGTYYEQFDWMGPLYFFPGQCMKKTSWQIPRTASPIIAFIDNDNEASKIMRGYFADLTDEIKENIPGFLTPPWKTQYYDNQTDLFDYISAEDYGSRTKKGICFGVSMVENAPNDYSVNLYFNDLMVPGNPFSDGVPLQSNPVWSPQQVEPDMSAFELYQRRAYAYVHNLAANAVLKASTQDDAANIAVMLSPVPGAVYQTDGFQAPLAGLLPIIILLAYIPPVYILVFHLVREKELGAKESMRMMGMTDAPYWLSWWFHFTCVNTVVSMLAWSFMCINIIENSQKGYILLFFWLYGEAIFGQMVFIQAFFSSSKFAGPIATIFYFGASLLNNLLDQDSLSYTKKAFTSLLPQAALQQGAQVFAQYECSGVGINKSTAGIQFDNYSFNTALFMLFVSAIVFTGLGLYLDQTIPSKYGKRRNPCFCFMPSYYGCCRSTERRQRVSQQAAENLLDESFESFEAAKLDKENYEAPPAICKRLEANGDFLKIESLSKEFGDFQAVNDLNVKMYDGQIFALLGHNGAGKTTTISMLTGLISRTSGSAQVYEKDLFEEADQVREFMGVCPQHDVLFDMLTPREHLDIFYDFKGGDQDLKEEEIEDIITKVGLNTDQNKVCSTLSGGNRRKTSVSMALIGGSKLVILDEPTSGMDLGARRMLWDMLKQYKRDRIIILTTHYMDEADVLGDRIGIMASGQIQCLGSSLFLKSKFGSGYKISFVKKNKRVNRDLVDFLCSHFRGVEKQAEVAGEVTFLIPTNQSQSFKTFFQQLDDNLERFEIKSYGVSMTTLEEVFININSQLNEKGNLNSNDQGNALMSSSDLKVNVSDKFGNMSQSSKSEDSANLSSEDEEYLVNGSSCCTTVGASSVKRWNIYRRDYCGFICQVISPLILITAGLIISTQPSTLFQNPPRFLSTALYPQQRILMSSESIVMAGDGSDISGQTFFNNLPNVTSEEQPFEVTYVQPLANNSDFYNEVYEARLVEPLFPYRYGSYQVYRAIQSNNTYQINNYLNVTSQDVSALFPQYMYTSVLRSANNDPEFNFDVTTYPFPVFYASQLREQTAKGFDYVFMLSIALALIPCVVVSFILREREGQLKHQQQVSGMSMLGYWTSNTISDCLSAYVPIIFIIILNVAFSLENQYAWLFLILYPLAIVPFSYVTSFIYQDDTTAQICTLFMNFLAGGTLMPVVYILQLVPVTAVVGDVLRYIFLIFPPFCVTHALVLTKELPNLVNSRNESIEGDYPDLPPLSDDLWSWSNLKADVAALLAHFILGLTIVALIESPLFDCWKECACCEKPTERDEQEMDDDVLEEEERLANMPAYTDAGKIEGDQPIAISVDDVEAGQDTNQFNSSTNRKSKRSLVATQSDVIQVRSFQKTYKQYCSQVRAVQGVSFGLDYGECFALLGVNGAGKSTTFKSLTRDIVPTNGQILVQGHDVQKEFTKARKLIGYCPQVDAIFPLMTVEEHLWYFARVKGIHSDKRASSVEKAIVDLNLSIHRHKPAGTLSGGNKRKLSVAMALIGNPPIILLDEPSAGMDPAARKFMWSLVEKISQKEEKSAVILTTHSMEEAEALSTKLGIMVRGGIFRCFGTSQHVKNKFGIGYELEIKVRKPQLRELEELAREYGYGNTLQAKVELKQACRMAKERDFDPAILDQVRPDANGAHLDLEADLDPMHEVKIEHFVTYLYSQRIGFSVIRYLAEIFAQVELLEQCGDFYKLRVPKEDKTIGWLFGQIEDNKERLGIQEYGISQTTLEQIFQMFANQSILQDRNAFVYKMIQTKLVLMNPHREQMQDQLETVSRGLTDTASRIESNFNSKFVSKAQLDEQTKRDDQSYKSLSSSNLKEAKIFKSQQ